MDSYLSAIAARLAPDQVDMLKRIYEPIVVATPLKDSRRDVCVLPDGEIRSYGRLYGNLMTGEPGVWAYLSSVDGGLSWQKRYAKGKMNACVYFPAGNIYVASIDSAESGLGKSGLRVWRSKIGPDDPDPEEVLVSEDNYNCAFQPQKAAACDRIWFTAQKREDGDSTDIGFFFSDDFGKTWQTRIIPDPMGFEVVFPHKGLRWSKNSGTEPHVAEIAPGKLMMIIRSATDQFWQCFSEDLGETWSTPEPSTFYGTDTTAYLLRLHDGRTLAFWNNTRPLPEPNHRVTQPPVGPFVEQGRGEDAFTNRDAAHVAITEDGGESWIGYRELILNPIRNNADFRYASADKSTRDKSVHQFQAIELPFNKILVSAGQNTASRRLIIFDLDWLYETTRKNNFLRGMEELTTHTFVKSVSGSYIDAIGNGHCAWNRTYSAYMMPDPMGGVFETLSIAKHHDDRLLSDIGGACWNFPMARKGRVTVEFLIREKSARFVLADRWFNPSDAFAAAESPFWFELTREDVGEGYHTLEIHFDVEGGKGKVSLDGKPFFGLRMKNSCPTGISYLILQCATDGDSAGFNVKYLEKE
ncbi:MAG: exo-alpha-sialidase [Clostridia bacterium]|nr:exo-alpha-sialidase [Clostridia bacterium]